MKVFCTPRRSGKTTELIKQCAEHGGYIVCTNKDEALRVSQRAKKMGLNIPLPLCADEFLKGQYHGIGIERLYIDNADLILQQIAKVPIEAISVSKTHFDPFKINF